MKKCTVGIDAHKETNVLALAFNDMKPATVYGKISTDLNRTVDAIRKIQKKHDLTKDDLQISYEAGPTGFVLARRLIHLGYDCIVVAPSLVPTKPGKKRDEGRSA
jgi:transposase